MFLELLIFAITFLIGYCFYIHKRIHSHFDKYGVKYVPGIPVFGNSRKTFMNKGHMFDDIDAVYKAFPGEKYVGLIEGTKSTLLIRDPEIIKNITVKDFDHFVNRKDFFSDGDALLGESLLQLRDDKWRHMRSTLSPSFTGSKMRAMLPFMMKIGNNLMEYLKDHIKKESDIVHVAELMRRYTNDVIASTAFGYEVNSLVDKDNEFYAAGQDLFKLGFLQSIVFFCKSQSPMLASILKLQSLPRKTIDFFQNLVSTTIEYRRKNNVERPDMFQLLMETSKDWTKEDITCQAFVFFFGGFETTASTLTMCIHELALNPEAQERLYEEVKSFSETTSGLTFENINDLKYLNNVINETSRKWSIAIVLDRTCTKPYELPPPREGGKPYLVKPGDIVYNSVNSLHMDPEHFPNPEVFDPDRFSDENKDSIKPFTFLPFGVGPRSCIGSRYALLEMKIVLYMFVLNFKIHKCEKTMDPIKLGAGFLIKARDDTWVRLELRK